jgi:branched-chain amino acid transport system permease protein
MTDIALLIRRSLAAAAWITLISFPMVAVKVNTVDRVVTWRWKNVLIAAAAAFAAAAVSQILLNRRRKNIPPASRGIISIINNLNSSRPKIGKTIALALVMGSLILPWIASMYQIDILSTALIYVMLGLGLNIVVGFGGLLNLGYVAFYAIGAYSYALLNHHLGLSFWIALPAGALLAMIFGVILALPLLRLKGDYLAIVTLAFAEILRLFLENQGSITFGPGGISNIPRPSIPFINLNLNQSSILVYYIMIALAIITIIITRRLEHSRLGRSWVAMREDELATEAMGINTVRIKLLAFTFGAAWAGIAGVMFAAKTTFINPASFTVWESIVVLCIVVLGGIGSVYGVILAALLMILVPEYLRFFSEYRMLIFGSVLMLMMVFKPGGIKPAKRWHYTRNDGSASDV